VKHFIKNLLIALLFIGYSVVIKAQTADSITHDGITWRFSGTVPIGRFVNGDYYVVGPVTIEDIDPLPTAENGRHGSVLNMPVQDNDVSPFDSRVSSGRYAPELRIYPPFTMNPGDILISSISMDEIGDYEPWLREGQETPPSPVRSVSVLTCLPERVSADAFRPSYVDTTLHIYYADNLRRDLLPNLPRVEHTPDIEIFAWHFRRPWLDICFFEFDAAVEYQAAYGRETGRSVGMATLLLMLDFTPGEKEELLVNIVQYGIDLWGIAKAGYFGWPAHGGHGTGRKWPIIFAGIMLDDSEMRSPNTTLPDLRFGEDMQTMYDECWTGANVVYAGHQGVWNGEAVSSRPSWGPYEHLHPSVWESTFEGESWYYIGEDYRRCCTSIAWIGQGLAALIMNAKEYWNHDAFFDYIDRWMREDDEPYVAAIYEATGLDYSRDWQRQGQAWDQFVEEMWAEYRDSFDFIHPDTTTLNLQPNYPNPFNTTTTINYAVTQAQNIKLIIYDPLGRKIRVLVNEYQSTGPQSIQWDGTDSQGKRVPSGTYFYQIRGEDGFASGKKMILIK
jgi:hypothetical protein